MAFLWSIPAITEVWTAQMHAKHEIGTLQVAFYVSASYSVVIKTVVGETAIFRKELMTAILE